MNDFGGVGGDENSGWVQLCDNELVSCAKGAD